MADFAGATFKEDGQQYPLPDVQGIAVKTRIAGGGLVIQRPASATNDRKISIPAQVSLAEYAALVELVDSQGTLTTEDYTETAWFDAIRGNPGGWLETGVYFVTLEFTLL